MPSKQIKLPSFIPFINLESSFLNLEFIEVINIKSSFTCLNLSFSFPNFSFIFLSNSL